MPTIETSAPFIALDVGDAPEVIAPDGSAVRVLVRSESGSMAQFLLPGFAVSRAVVHRTVTELWYFIAGRGQMWLSFSGHEAIVDVVAGSSIAVPVGTAFQFCSRSADALQVVAVTMPPWPGDGEAVVVSGPWSATV